jgi:hypothetical protein
LSSKEDKIENEGILFWRKLIHGSVRIYPEGFGEVWD